MAGVGLAALIVLTAAAVGAGSAQAGGLKSHRVSGIQIAISCLSPRLCVSVGYNAHSIGDVIALHNGVPGHAMTVHGTQSIESVSCAGASGCVAVGRTSNDVGVQMVTIGKGGKVTKSVRVKLPSGVTIGRVDCVKIRSCEVVGTQFFTHPMAIEVGSWNGKKLTLHRLAGVHGSSSLSIQSVACHGSSCIAVGSVDVHVGQIVGVIVPIHHGHPSPLHKAKGDALYSASCPGAKRCYAVGFDSKGGVILTLHGASVTSTAAVTPDLSGIACHGSACTAVGQTLPPPPAAPPSSFYGTITRLSAGKVTSTVSVPVSGGYSGVAQPTAGFFAAIGRAQQQSSELTTG